MQYNIKSVVFKKGQPPHIFLYTTGTATLKVGCASSEQNTGSTITSTAMMIVLYKGGYYCV